MGVWGAGVYQGPAFERSRSSHYQADHGAVHVGEGAATETSSKQRRTSSSGSESVPTVEVAARAEVTEVLVMVVE